MAKPIPTIVIHQCDTAPSGHRFLGSFYSAGGKRLPILFNGDNADSVTTSMREFWDAEQRMAARVEEARANISARMKKINQKGGK